MGPLSQVEMNEQTDLPNRKIASPKLVIVPCDTLQIDYICKMAHKVALQYAINGLYMRKQSIKLLCNIPQIDHTCVTQIIQFFCSTLKIGNIEEEICSQHPFYLRILLIQLLCNTLKIYYTCLILYYISNNCTTDRLLFLTCETLEIDYTCVNAPYSCSEIHQ